eukprot:scaffold2995_cov120-Isochrysis_galbana.AAC.4
MILMRCADTQTSAVEYHTKSTCDKFAPGSAPHGAFSRSSRHSARGSPGHRCARHRQWPGQLPRFGVRPPVVRAASARRSPVTGPQ